MQAKKYRAKSIQEATAKVKNVLGPDAMIVSTNKLKGNGENSVFEITAMPPVEVSPDNTSTPVGEMKSALMTLKEMIYLMHHSDGILERLVLNPVVLNLYAKLIRCGVRDFYAKQFLERAGAFNGHSSETISTVREKTIKEIMNVIQVRKPFAAKDNRRIAAAFIGTTGVGKTTTIAKLAAQLMLKGEKKVGLISIDTYRIGAMEQLKTYADILGIPCFQAFKRKDLHFALKRLEGRDIILIDTAGQSQYDQARLEDLKRMLVGDSAICSHLLLSAGTTEGEMNTTAMNFSPLNYQSYIFTKIDETKKCGSMLNQIIKRNLPISYITTGQNVPEDIEQADKAKILNLLFNKN
ncbi:MAG: hypothetical protein H8E17_18075 [Deltaproteobacteria bacterium]|nr:hypothetical protein [Deltaproteobacteria bacterium]